MKLIDIINSGEISQCDDNIGTDKERNHRYISNFYEKEFEIYKSKKIEFLEIGIYTGDSLLLWRKYFENANIYEVDINLDLLAKKYDEINYIIADAYSQDFVNNIGNFDIIIDDGPHSLDSQIKFLELYYPKLNQGGLMVIEDIHHSDEEISLLINIASRFGAKYEFIDTKQLYNSKLLSIKKIN